MKETIYIRKNSPIHQANSASLHIIYRNTKATVEYDDPVFVRSIEEYREEVRKETAKQIVEMLKASKMFVKNHFEAYDELIENIVTKYGIELFENSDELEDKE